MKRISIIISILILIISSNLAISKSIKTDNDFFVDKEENSIIKGYVMSAVTCRPDPLLDAKVTAIKLDSINFDKYTTFTNSSGQFLIEVPNGLYQIKAEKDNYGSITPKIFFIERIESNDIYEFEFYLRPKRNTYYNSYFNSIYSLYQNIINHYF
jgi:hypothetical protein